MIRSILAKLLCRATGHKRRRRVKPIFGATHITYICPRCKDPVMRPVRKQKEPKP